MNRHDFAKLQSLLEKLNTATSKAAQTDLSFKKYHTNSMHVLQELPSHLHQLEQGLRTANVVRED